MPQVGFNKLIYEGCVTCNKHGIFTIEKWKKISFISSLKSTGLSNLKYAKFGLKGERYVRIQVFVNTNGR